MVHKIISVAEHFQDIETYFNRFSLQSDQRQFPDIHALMSIQRKVKTKLFQFYFSNSVDFKIENSELGNGTNSMLFFY